MNTLLYPFANDQYSDEKEKEKVTKDVIQRAIKYCPELNTMGGVRVLENIVGYRPSRKDGPRIQNEYYSKFYSLIYRNENLTKKELILASSMGKKTLITHNYGHGGSGYQSSWGSCQEAVRLISQGHSTLENERSKIKRLLSRL